MGVQVSAPKAHALLSYDIRPLGFSIVICKMGTLYSVWTSLVVQLVKNLPAMQGTPF